MECITKDEIQSILREKENDNSITVEEIAAEPAVGKGENFMSIAIKICIKGKKSQNGKVLDFSRSLFMKKQFESDEAKALFNSDRVFSNEALAYNEILPALEESLGEPLAIPKCYKADKNLVILGDLFSEGYGMNEGKKTLTIDQCCAVLKELAKLHAASYILKAKYPEKFQNLSEKVSELLAMKNSPMIKFFERSMDSTKDYLQTLPQNEEIKGFIEKITKLKTTIFNDLIDLLENKTDTVVFNHGDCWMNNLLFKNEGPILVKLVDWQIMRLTSPAADLSYFLYINLYPEVRKDKLDYLLSFYLNHLHLNLQQHKIEKFKLILDKKWIVNEMKRFSKLGFIFGMMIMPIFYVNKQDLPGMEEMAVSHMENETVKNIFVQGQSEEYKKVLTDFLRNFFDENDV